MISPLVIFIHVLLIMTVSLIYFNVYRGTYSKKSIVFWIKTIVTLLLDAMLIASAHFFLPYAQSIDIELEPLTDRLFLGIPYNVRLIILAGCLISVCIVCGKLLFAALSERRALIQSKKESDEKLAKKLAKLEINTQESKKSVSPAIPAPEKLEEDSPLHWSYIDLIAAPNWKSGSVLFDIAMNKISDNQMAYWHDENMHFALFKIPSGKPKYDSVRREFKEKANSDRRRLKSFTKPRIMKDPMFKNDGSQVVSFDRTHLFPIGFIGTELDERVIVWFDSNINKGELNSFEQKIKPYVEQNGACWLTVLEKRPDGKIDWHFRIFDHEMTLKVDKLDVTSNSLYDWSDKV